MKQSIEYKNLALITDDFRNTGRALTGYKNLKADLNNFKFLENILRDHRNAGITKSSEIAYRDQVDFLLKYYSLLELGVITGYLPRELNVDIRNEVSDILGNEHVMKYYTEIYPLTLPKLLYKWSTNSFTQPVRANNTNKEVFAQILLLDSLLDDDVEDFLWMLDSGVTNQKSIRDLNALLSNKMQIGKLLEKPKEDEDALDRSFWGFIKFTDYMVRYKKVIEQCDDTLISSAVWHYQGYWFQNMKDLMKGRYIDAIRSIEKLKDDISPEEFFGAKGSVDITEKYGQWQVQAGEEVNKIIEAITYLLDQRNGETLDRYATFDTNGFASLM